LLQVEGFYVLKYMQI